MTEEAERKLQELHEAAERISSNLVELELDSSRQLLEASALVGQSAETWSAASDALTELWRRHGLLESLLKRADKLHGFKRADQLRSLLDSSSIELGSTTVPLAQRQLLGSAQVAERCTPAQLISAMSASFEQVKQVVSRIGDVWEALIPKIDFGRRMMNEARAVAEQTRDADLAQLDAMSTRLETLGAAVTADPLSVSSADVDGLIQAIRVRRDELDAGAAFQRGFDAKVLAARELLEQLRSAQADGRATQEELVTKIQVTAAPAAPEQDDDLDRELTEVGELAQAGSWQTARRALDDWTGRADALLAEARRTAAANRAPIETRNQFRALLEAYRVKAKRLHRVEDPELAEIFARAHDLLYTAPTDLAVAAQLVRRYQQTLNGSGSGTEVAR
jgi:hypothetical protein